MLQKEPTKNYESPITSPRLAGTNISVFVFSIAFGVWACNLACCLLLFDFVR